MKAFSRGDIKFKFWCSGWPRITLAFTETLYDQVRSGPSDFDTIVSSLVTLSEVW